MRHGARAGYRNESSVKPQPHTIPYLIRPRLPSGICARGSSQFHDGMKHMRF